MSVYVLADGLVELVVVSCCKKSSAPGPLTSAFFSEVMSKSATRSRVARCSAAAIGDQYLPAHSPLSGTSWPSSSVSFASNHCGRSQPDASRK